MLEGEMEDRTIIYRREEFFAEVWSEPAMTVAKRYRVSGTDLAKTCRKLAVPLQPRGYWAKTQAGQRIPRTPLPPYAGKTEMRTVKQMSDQGGHIDVSGEECLDGDKGEGGAEGDPATTGRSRPVRTVP